MRNDLLLLSNSTLHGHGFLEHALDAIASFLDGREIVHFAPFALADHGGYTAKVADALEPLGARVIGLHEIHDPRGALEEAEVLFVGGGNTFRLLRALQRLELLEPVRRSVRSGKLSYMGSSAGTNHACPTIRTTNDMPIVEPHGFEAFGLIPFQINPHYQDPPADSTHMGETREQRIREFLEENDVPVLGMREGSWLRRQEDTLTLQGTTGALLFRRGRDPEPLSGGAELSELLR
jgi:dipeptidase E